MSWDKKSIVIDIDGVLADFVLGFTRLAHDNLDKSIATIPSRFHQQWNFDGVMTPQQSAFIWKYINEHPGWWGTLPPLVGGDIGRRLNILSLKAPIYFVTHRPDDAQSVTARWLRREIGIEAPTVILSKKKGEVARLLHATHAIDDKLENALCLAIRPRTSAGGAPAASRPCAGVRCRRWLRTGRAATESHRRNRAMWLRMPIHRLGSAAEDFRSCDRANAP